MSVSADERDRFFPQSASRLNPSLLKRRVAYRVVSVGPILTQHPAAMLDVVRPRGFTYVKKIVRNMLVGKRDHFVDFATPEII